MFDSYRSSFPTFFARARHVSKCPDDTRLFYSQPEAYDGQRPPHYHPPPPQLNSLPPFFVLLLLSPLFFLLEPPFHPSTHHSTKPSVIVHQMTGLNPQTDIILSISCFVTDSHLNPLPDSSGGYHATILTPESTLSSMSAWCVTTHTATGLVAACLDPSQSVSASTAAANLLAFVKHHIPKRGTALLAGNSVHADKMFLVQDPWTPVVEWLHYRILDVSAIKEGVRRWCGEDILTQVPRKEGRHSAREDILESLEEARFYMRLFEKMKVEPEVGKEQGGKKDLGQR